MYAIFCREDVCFVGWMQRIHRWYCHRHLPTDIVLETTRCVKWTQKEHALKFQTLNIPDSLIFHAYVPLERCRQDWALYIRSITELQMKYVCMEDGK